MKTVEGKKRIGIAFAALAAALAIVWYAKLEKPNSSTPVTESALKPHSSPRTEAVIPERVLANSNSAPEVAKSAKQAKPDDDRLAAVTRAVTSTYFPAIKGLKLSPEKEAKLMQLLIGRTMAAYDANSVVSANRSLNQGDLINAIDYAQAQVDQEINEEFGAEVGKTVSLMIEASGFIRNVNEKYGPVLRKAGVPLADEQVLPLSLVLYSSYGSVNNPDAVPRQDNIDEIGLTRMDREAIQRANSVLTPAQVDSLRAAIGKVNQAYVQRRLKEAGKS